MSRSLVLSAALSLSLLPTLALAQQHTVVALSHSDNTAYELDPATGRIVNRFTAENQPHEAIASPDGRSIYVAIPQAGHVVILDATTFTQRARVESPFFRNADGSSTSPHGIAITSDGSKVYVGTERSDIPSIVVFDGRTGQVLKKLDVMLEGGHFLAIDQRTNKLYYPMRTDNRVMVIDTRTDEVTKIIPVEGGPVGVAFTPNGEAWIHSDYDGSVTVIDMAKDEVVQRITNTGTGAGRIAVSPDGRWAASTHGTSMDVAIIDTRTREVAARVPVGGLGFPLFSPDSNRLYVMTAATFTGTPPNVTTKREGGVTVIDLATKQAVARWQAGVNPFGGDIRYVGGRTAASARP
jgi:YVTN family beta-propeller protein